MLRNLRVGAKIILGFGVVVVFMIAILVTVVVTNTASSENLTTIGEYSTFQTTTNSFIDFFSDARIASNIVYIQNDEAEFKRAVDSYNNAKTELANLTRQISGNSALSDYAQKVPLIETRIDKWFSLLAEVNSFQSALDHIKATFIQTGGVLSGKIMSLYEEQLKDAHGDMNAESSELLRRVDRLDHAASIAIDLGNLRRIFIRIIDLFEIELSEQALADAGALIESVELYISESRQQKYVDLGNDILEDLTYYVDLVGQYTNQMNNHLAVTAQARDEASAATSIVVEMISTLDKAVADEISLASASGHTAQTITIVLSTVALFTAVLVALFIMRSITKPINLMVSVARNLADGQINIGNVSYNSKDELGELFMCMKDVTMVLDNLISDMQSMADAHDKGDTDARVDEKRFNGAYGEMAEKTNTLLSSYLGHLRDMSNCLGAFGNGDFNAPFAPLPGKKAVLNKSIETLRNNLKTVSKDISVLIDAANKGDLSKKADETKYKGDWANLLKDLNNLMYAITVPINEVAEVMGELSKGNFNKSMDGDYHGDFLSLKNNINGMVTNISSYIKEISQVLEWLADNDLTHTISRNYVGEFANIKNAINDINKKLSGVISEITTATEQVTSGTRQISESSMTLAQGATEQASAVQELTATVMSVNEKTRNNADNARRAASLSDELKDHAATGNKQMKNMLNSMKDINEASGNISKIINIIKDISFQTNLLALNASIEAAHAGVHGAGFSVVADEVRSLAVKSQEAANDTTELIETTIQKVNEGTSIAEQTDQALNMIVDGVTQVSDIIDDIAEASDEQSIAISQINEGVNQISQVVQDNSATSEESASAAQELSSQTDVLHQMVSVFKLKN